MEVKKLENIGVEVKGLHSPQQIVAERTALFRLLMENSVVVLKDLDLQKADFTAISKAFGVCNTPHYYFNDPEFPEIFLVTNEKIDGQKAGMFSDHELNWHANGCSRKHTIHHGVGLYCVMSQSNVATEWCDTRKSFKSLPASDQEFLSNVEINVGVGDFTFYLLGEKDPEREILLRQQGGWKSLTGKHPNWDDSYCLFHHFFIQEVRHKVHGNLNKQEFIESYLNRLIHEDFIYSHRFVAGDLVLSDQLFSIHRRGPVEADRLLYRSAFDYSHSK